MNGHHLRLPDCVPVTLVQTPEQLAEAAQRIEAASVAAIDVCTCSLAAGFTLQWWPLTLPAAGGVGLR